MLDDDWKGTHSDLIQSVEPHLPIGTILCSLHEYSDLVLIECSTLAVDYKEKALRVKCSRSSKDWRKFCLSQLARNVGARILHRYSNRHSLAPSVPLFKPGGAAKTPNEAVELDAKHWKRF